MLAHSNSPATESAKGRPWAGLAKVRRLLAEARTSSDYERERELRTVAAELAGEHGVTAGMVGRPEYSPALYHCERAGMGISGCPDVPHQAELLPNTNYTFIYAEHGPYPLPGEAGFVPGNGGGGWLTTCAASSGLCHDECWPHERDPDLRGRIEGVSREGV
jgi:hypothetical protein